VLFLDASTAVSWCFEETQTPFAIGVLDGISQGLEVHVPHIWPLEVTNALVKAFRRKHITRDELFDDARQIPALRPIVDLGEPAERAFHDVLALAGRHRLTTYDAACLELAQCPGFSLATAGANPVPAAGAVRMENPQPRAFPSGRVAAPCKSSHVECQRILV
jgi:predicted nucleic acid-binding protein